MKRMFTICTYVNIFISSLCEVTFKLTKVEHMAQFKHVSDFPLNNRSIAKLTYYWYNSIYYDNKYVVIPVMLPKYSMFECI